MSELKKYYLQVGDYYSGTDTKMIRDDQYGDWMDVDDVEKLLAERDKKIKEQKQKIEALENELRWYQEMSAKGIFYTINELKQRDLEVGAQAMNYAIDVLYQACEDENDFCEMIKKHGEDLRQKAQELKGE